MAVLLKNAFLVADKESNCHDGGDKCPYTNHNTSDGAVIKYMRVWACNGTRVVRGDVVR